VLLVEDVRVAQRIAARALQTAHYRVDVASSGEAAVERFRAHRRTLKLVLMDINLPGIDGIAATEQIRRIETDAQEAEETAARPQQQEQTQEQQQQQHQQPQQTPPSLLFSSPVLVLGLTGNVDESNLRLYEQAGMNGCIVKGRQLGDAVRQAVRMWHERPGTFINLVTSSAFAPLPAAASASPASSSSASGSPAVAASPIVQSSPSENAVAAAAGSSSAARSDGCGCGCSCVDHCACPSNCACATACPLTKRARRGHTDTTASTRNGADGHSEDGNSNSDTRMH
jgi:CheY-like chemotaxis protein